MVPLVALARVIVLHGLHGQGGLVHLSKYKGRNVLAVVRSGHLEQELQ